MMNQAPSQPLAGVRILSLALNLPGPAALMRCQEMGAVCVKIEPPAGDPMKHYRAEFYASLGEGVEVLSADLKSDAGQQLLAHELQRTDVLLSSFRPSAIEKLGLGWAGLQAAYPRLSHVAIVGAAGERAEEPGHDLTYLAEHDLVAGLELPATLFADMSGALLAVCAVLRCVLARQASGVGSFEQVALADAAAWLALPRRFGLTQASGAVGGAHAGYQVYPCQDGRVATAALEPHFARGLCEAAGLNVADAPPNMFDPATLRAIATFFLSQTRAQVDELARQCDLPLHTLDPIQ